MAPGGTTQGCLARHGSPHANRSLGLEFVQASMRVFRTSSRSTQAVFLSLKGCFKRPAIYGGMERPQGSLWGRKEDRGEEARAHPGWIRSLWTSQRGSAVHQRRVGAAVCVASRAWPRFGPDGCAAAHIYSSSISTSTSTSTSSRSRRSRTVRELFALVRTSANAKRTRAFVLWIAVNQWVSLLCSSKTRI